MCATLYHFRRPSPNFAVVVYRHQTTERPAGSRPAHPRMLVAAAHQSAAACPCHTVVSRRVGIFLSHTLTPDCALCSALATAGQGSRVWISRASEHLCAAARPFHLSSLYLELSAVSLCSSTSALTHAVPRLTVECQPALHAASWPATPHPERRRRNPKLPLLAPLSDRAGEQPATNALQDKLSVGSSLD